jgi:tRNA A-37 threonylcarbamoyl transferase component Bud32
VGTPWGKLALSAGWVRGATFIAGSSGLAAGSETVAGNALEGRPATEGLAENVAVASVTGPLTFGALKGVAARIPMLQDAARKAVEIIRELTAEAELGNQLVAHHLLTPAQLEECLQEQKKLISSGHSVPLARLFIDRGFLTIDRLLQLLEVRNVERKIGDEKSESICRLEEGGWIGHYRLLRQIARGGMGVVFEAEDPRLKRSVAIKVIREEDLESPEVLIRFHREATIVAQLHHPNIVTLHEFGMVRDPRGKALHFLVMEYVEGHTLQEIIPDSSVRRPERLRILEELAQAVAYAHGKGVVHRDLKPGNVMVAGFGEVLVVDWGLARRNDAFDAASQELRARVEKRPEPDPPAP